MWDLVRRLKQRKVVRWTLAYVAGVAVLIGLVADVSGGFAWGTPVLRATVAVTAVGLIATVVVAWYHGDRGRQRVSRAESLLLAGLALTAGGVGWVAFSTAPLAPEAGGLPGVADIDARAVAVLPCEAASVEAADAGIVSLGDRWAEELIRKLVRVAGLRPKEWASVRRYRGSGKTAEEVGSELRAGSVVRCAVVEDPGTVRLTAELIRVDDSSLLWSETFQRPPGRDAVNAVQSAAVLGLARALGVEVPQEGVRRVGRPLTQDTAALRLYRLGQQFFEVGDRPAQRRAIVHFDSAIARDSAFALAYVALARSKVILGNMEAWASREYYPEAGRLLRKAIELEGGLAEARTWLGQYLLDYTHDWEAAEEEHGKAVALNPASWQAHTWYGFHLQMTGRLERAIEEYEEAVALDPVAYFPRLFLARSLALAGRLDQASEANRRGWELYPGHAAFAHNEAIILVLEGEADSAVAIMEGSADPYSWPNGPLYALAGRPDVTRRILDSLMVRSETEPVDPLAIAVQHAGLGNREEARQWLERAYAERSGLLLYAIGRHIWTEPLQGDPEFEALRRRVGFPARD